MSSNTLTTIAHFPQPPDKIITFLQSPTNLLELNPHEMVHTQTSVDPPIYSIKFNIPILFGLFSIPVTTQATFEIMGDGILVTTETTGAKTSSRWSVAAGSGDEGGSVLVVEFKLLDCWWGLRWFILWSTKGEYQELVKILERRLEE